MPMLTADAKKFPPFSTSKKKKKERKKERKKKERKRKKKKRGYCAVMILLHLVVNIYLVRSC